MATPVPVVISKSVTRDWLILALERSVTDTVTKCEKPISWWLMNAHEKKQRFVLSAVSPFLSLCKTVSGWTSLRSILLITMVVQGQHTSYQSSVYSRLRGNQFFSCIHSE